MSLSSTKMLSMDVKLYRGLLLTAVGQMVKVMNSLDL